MKKLTLATFSAITGVVVGITVQGKLVQKEPEKEKGSNKFKNYYHMLNQWLLLKQKGISLEKYFIDRGYKKIAIYGMGEMGGRLYDELKDSCITVQYAVDQNAEAISTGLKIITKEEEFEETDAMVITATFAFAEIEEEVQKKFNGTILSLDDIVYELSME